MRPCSHCLSLVLAAAVLGCPSSSSNVEPRRSGSQQPQVLVPSITEPTAAASAVGPGADPRRLPFEGCFEPRHDNRDGFYLAGAMADLDGDGRKDIAALASTEDKIALLISDGAGSFSKAGEIGANSEALGIAAADFNGDGQVDLATGNYRNNTVSVMLAEGKLRYGVTKNIRVGPKVGGSPGVADLDGDGHLDLLVPLFNQVRILIGDGRGGFSLGRMLKVGEAPATPIAKDFDGDGASDLAVASNDSHFLSVFLRRDGRLADEARYKCGMGGAGIAAGDLDGDGKLDVAMAAVNSGTTCVFRGAGGGKMSAPIETSEGGWSVAMHDFDRDGRHELLIGSALDRRSARRSLDWGVLSIHRADAQGNLARFVSFATRAPAQEIWIDDVDRDGREDIVTLHQKGLAVLLGRSCDGPPPGAPTR